MHYVLAMRNLIPCLGLAFLLLGCGVATVEDETSASLAAVGAGDSCDTVDCHKSKSGELTCYAGCDPKEAHPVLCRDGKLPIVICAGPFIAQTHCIDPKPPNGVCYSIVIENEGKYVGCLVLTPSGPFGACVDREYCENWFNRK